MRNHWVVGILLILVGSIWLLGTIGIIEEDFWELSWPLFVLIPGIIFHIMYFSKNVRNAGILVPGGILTVVGGLLLFHTIYGWNYSDVTWPFYILAVALGLFELYLFGGREKAILIPVFILTAIGGFFVIENFFDFPFQIVWPIVLILIGLTMIFRPLKHK